MDAGFTMFVHSERTLSPVIILVLLVQSLNFFPHAFIQHSIHSYNIPIVHTIFEEDFFLMKLSIVRLWLNVPNIAV